MLSLCIDSRRSSWRLPVALLSLWAAVTSPAAIQVPEFTSESLAARTAPVGNTMFVELSAEQTGVASENLYADPRMWGDRYQEFALGGMGTGVAIGDFDNDGRPDLFVVSKTEQCRLFRNLGDWKFEDVTATAGLGTAASVLEEGLSWMKNLVGAGDTPTDSIEAWKQGATWADINNDGWLDLYVCRFGAPNWLFVNQRDGTFKEEAVARGLAVVDASGLGAFCDYDRDGWLDVYLQTNMLNAVSSPGGQPDRLFRNNGDGTFKDVSQLAGIGGASLTHSTTWWDYNDDGWMDIYVANDFAPPDTLYRNNGDGTFTNVIHDVLPTIPYSAMGADFGDVDNDGRIDLFVADMAATTHEKDQRGMASSRALSRDDSDSASLTPQTLRNTLYLNQGPAGMQEIGWMAGLGATDWTWSVRFEDFDNDGRLDLHVTNGMNREYQNSDLRERIILAESPDARLRIMKASPLLAEANLVYRNQGDLAFEEVSAAWGLNQVGVSFGVATGDLDGDGDLDIVYGNYEKSVTVMRNESVSGHRMMIALRGTQSNKFGYGAKVTVHTATGVQVRQMMPARGYLSSSEPVLHFGLGEVDQIARVEIAWPSGLVQVLEGLAVDRRYTVTEPKDGPKNRTAPHEVVYPAGQFVEVSGSTGLNLKVPEGAWTEDNRQPLLTTRFDRRGPALAIADIDGDGASDVVVGGNSISPVSALLRDSVGRFGANGSMEKLELKSTGPMLFFEVNGDGHADALLTQAGTEFNAGAEAYQPKLLLNDGHGGWTLAGPSDLPIFPVSVGALAAADFDRDGQLDVFVGGRVEPGKYPTSPRSALWLNRDGRFEDATASIAADLASVGMVTSAVWSDVDQDGWIDLVVTTEWGGVSVWRNESGRALTNVSEEWGFTAAGSGWWTSIASADFNGDGRPDFALGNVGLNTPYKATAEHPALLFRGNFVGRGRSAPQLIEAYYEGDRLYPRQTLKALSAEIRTLTRSFRRNDDYSVATLDEIFGAETIAAAERFEATELRSGVLLSEATGGYHFQPLPRESQIAPFQGIVAGDVDGDGNADIYAVQNSYAPAPVMGRFTGGISQLLRGDGRGGFLAEDPNHSGLVVRGDAKALGRIDLDADGWPDFVVTRNNSSILAFRNEGVSGRRMVRIVLQGPVGNPWGIGAQVEFGGSGVPQFAEVTAGSGYWSQSEAAVFFGRGETALSAEVNVRWPDGSNSMHAVGAEESRVVLVAPNR
jgi:hypothetical protein